MYNYSKKLKDLDITYVWPVQEYVNSKTKILHEYSCGHRNLVSPNNIIANRRGCTICSSITKRKSTEEHTKEVYPLVFIGGYVNNRSKLEYVCPVGHRWSATPNNLLKSIRCPMCSNLESREYVQSRYTDKLLELGLVLSGEYIDSTTKTEHLCISKGHKIVASPASILHETKGCQYCSYAGPGLLYYIKIENIDNLAVYYKIGITTKKVEDRIKSLRIPNNYVTRVLRKEEFSNINDAREVEQSILRRHSNKRISVDFVRKGFTEFFSEDILGFEGN